MATNRNLPSFDSARLPGSAPPVRNGEPDTSVSVVAAPATGDLVHAHSAGGALVGDHVEAGRMDQATERTVHPAAREWIARHRRGHAPAVVNARTVIAFVVRGEQTAAGVGGVADRERPPSANGEPPTGVSTPLAEFTAEALP